MDLKKMLGDLSDQSNYQTWQGSIFALQEIRRHIDFEIKKYEDLKSSTEMDKILNKAKGI